MFCKLSILRRSGHIIRQLRCNVKVVSALPTSQTSRPQLSSASITAVSLHTCTVHRAGEHTPPSAELLSQLTDAEYEIVSEETLDSLTEMLEELADSNTVSDDMDVNYSSGVLTVKMGEHGTYVLNKQTPNKQIWLSSPTSGPKRYDFINNQWIYKHDSMSLHSLLSEELSQIFNEDLDFTQCAYGGKDS